MVKRYPRDGYDLDDAFYLPHTIYQRKGWVNKPRKIGTSVHIKMGEADRFPRLKRFPRFPRAYVVNGSILCICGNRIKWWSSGEDRSFCSEFCLFIYQIHTAGRTYPRLLRAEFHRYKARLKEKMAEGYDMDDATDLLAKEDRRKERAINKGLDRQGRLSFPAEES